MGPIEGDAPASMCAFPTPPAPMPRVSNAFVQKGPSGGAEGLQMGCVAVEWCVHRDIGDWCAPGEVHGRAPEATCLELCCVVCPPYPNAPLSPTRFPRSSCTVHDDYSAPRGRLERFYQRAGGVTVCERIVRAKGYCASVCPAPIDRTGSSRSHRRPT